MCTCGHTYMLHVDMWTHTHAAHAVDSRLRPVVPVYTHTHTQTCTKTCSADDLMSVRFCSTGASSGQRGFLGCMRGLKINGVTFDLEEKARVTPGVNPGCQGHCSSYGMHCKNGGTCVEQYNGYSCDCSHTAYDGAFCTDGTAAIFESHLAAASDL